MNDTEANAMTDTLAIISEMRVRDPFRNVLPCWTGVTSWAIALAYLNYCDLTVYTWRNLQQTEDEWIMETAARHESEYNRLYRMYSHNWSIEDASFT